MSIIKSLKNAILGQKEITATESMKIGDLRKDFREQYGVNIRIYKLGSNGKISTGRGAKLADDKDKLANVSTGKAGSIVLKKTMTVKQVEEEFAKIMGVGVQIECADGSLAADQARVEDLHKL